MARSTYGEQNGKDKPARKSGKVGAGYDAPFRGYINLSLTSEEKASFTDWQGDGSMPDALNAQCADGVNFSVKLDPRSEGFLASATQRREDSPNAGLVVTARARDPVTALARVVFSVAVLSRTERWEDTQPLADPDRW